MKFHTNNENVIEKKKCFLMKNVYNDKLAIVSKSIEIWSF